MADVMRIARPYARAIFELAQSTAQQEIWSQLLLWLEYVILDKQAENFFVNPTIDATIKVKFIMSLNVTIPTTGENLIKILAKSNRWILIQSIRGIYEKYLAAAKGLLEVDLISASVLSVAEKANIISKLSAKYGKKVALAVQVDPALFGGVIVKAGDDVIDASIKGQLQALHAHLLGNVQTMGQE